LSDSEVKQLASPLPLSLRSGPSVELFSPLVFALDPILLNSVKDKEKGKMKTTDFTLEQGKAPSALNCLVLSTTPEPEQKHESQFDLTVSQSERFLLSPHLRDKREVFRAEVIHK